jgi:hypothetical protein
VLVRILNAILKRMVLGMYKVIMKDTLNWMEDVKIRTRSVVEVLAFIRKYGGKADKDDILKSDVCEINTADGLKITVLND